MADALINAHKRGINVTVLLEGGPVGGISIGENEICSRLAREHIPVFLMGTTGISHAPYRYNHAKYIVIDGESLFITSENFTDNGFPGSGDTGNRGWGSASMTEVSLHISGIFFFWMFVAMEFFQRRENPAIRQKPSGENTRGNFPRKRITP